MLRMTSEYTLPMGPIVWMKSYYYPSDNASAISAKGWQERESASGVDFPRRQPTPLDTLREKACIGRKHALGA